MSIIEEAVRKTAQRHHGRAPGAQPIAPRARSRKTATPPVNASAARSFQRAPLDEEALARNLVLPQVRDAGALRAYKILRTRMLRRLEVSQARSFVVSGVTEGDGKTLTALNLAIALAQDVNTWVFLVDLDLHRSRIASYLGIGGDKGLSDYLVGEATLDEVVYAPDIPRFAVVPNFRAAPQASELLSSPRMSEFLAALESEQPRRIIVFDMPPLLAADDVLAFAPQTDGLLLVVSEGGTGRDALKSAKEILSEMNLLGVVLNRSAERNDSAYYSYAYQQT
ncbi:MAG TPA: CpsD/CapB family tyrosine-protein kinase [Steroidobacter sp.]|jgi:capsular exopolysaccharide synthesis family protein|nr:CpsD/CapB family tyrosine-protein kinase [Steroidobacteraceae bacterium]HLS81517.1 CpsD/CapB family tyrosine-protein kinase [Steroidobacter sp.]